MIKNWKYVLAIVSSLTFSTAYSQSVKDAQRAIELEKYEDATKTLSALSGNDEATLYLGDVYLKTGKKEQAAQTYAKVNASTPIGMVAAGKAALVKGNTAEAEKNFEAAIKASKKKDATIYRLIGKAYLDTEAKDVTKALAYLDAGQKLSKNKDAEAFIIAGDLHMLSNTGGPAASAYDQALVIDKNLAKAHVKRGLVFTGAKNYNEAQGAYQAAIAADPSYAPAFRELGENYVRVGKYPLAVENYKKYIDLVGNDAEAQTKYGQFLYLAKDFKGAQAAAESVLAKDPSNLKALRVAALAASENGENEKALANMEKFFSTAKQAEILSTDYAAYGRLLAKAGKNDLAQTNFDKALTMDASNIELLDDAAAFYNKQKNYTKAVELYKAKIAIKPSNVDNIKLADVYLGAGDFDNSDALYAKVLETNPTYTYAHIRRAEIAEQKDKAQTGAAKPLYEKYLQVASGDPVKNKAGLIRANYYLGFQGYKSKDFATARKHWQEVLKLDPGNKEAAIGIKNIDVQTKGKK